MTTKIINSTWHSKGWKVLDTVSFQNFKFVFAAQTLAIWNSRQYGQTGNRFAFRIRDAQFEIYVIWNYENLP